MDDLEVDLSEWIKEKWAYMLKAKDQAERPKSTRIPTKTRYIGSFSPDPVNLDVYLGMEPIR